HLPRGVVDDRACHRPPRQSRGTRVTEQPDGKVLRAGRRRTVAATACLKPRLGRVNDAARRRSQVASLERRSKMTLQEKELLARFLEQLRGAQAGPKDLEAEGMIREAVARQPDAAYLLVQRAIQLEQLLAAAQAEAQKARTELENAQSGARGTSFLNDNYAWGRSAGSG